ncbi:Mitochondrial inner membrane protease subunit 1 [Araneus ventricosus]|uniref:Mitochondrial inner membrane protease subunit n=1 Tax=Araneus ventricosus TaxID=182803 RepID=A0A4Y2IHL9_ARAVE|nr:Mitochondrial inner membrane protease subunit 1 [Araneus ventricosus]
MFSSLKLVKKVVTKALVITGYVGYTACVVHCTTEYIGDVVICQGPSMEPTLNSQDIMLTEHISIIRRNINRGDIIISRSPSNPKEFICKRIKGIPGDKIRTGFSSTVVPRGHVWLEGDNKNNSTDSRTYGPVPIGLLRSRAFCRIYPFNKAQMFSKS